MDLDESEEMDASEIHVNRLLANEVILPKSGENCKFPVADGTVQLRWEIRDHGGASERPSLRPNFENARKLRGNLFH